MNTVTVINIVKSLLFKGGAIVLVTGMIGYKALTTDLATGGPQLAEASLNGGAPMPSDATLPRPTTNQAP